MTTQPQHDRPLIYVADSWKTRSHDGVVHALYDEGFRVYDYRTDGGVTSMPRGSSGRRRFTSRPCRPHTPNVGLMPTTPP